MNYCVPSAHLEPVPCLQVLFNVLALQYPLLASACILYVARDANELCDMCLKIYLSLSDPTIRIINV